MDDFWQHKEIEIDTITLPPFLVTLCRSSEPEMRQMLRGSATSIRLDLLWHSHVANERENPQHHDLLGTAHLECVVVAELAEGVQPGRHQLLTLNSLANGHHVGKFQDLLLLGQPSGLPPRTHFRLPLTTRRDLLVVWHFLVERIFGKENRTRRS